jgi:hypothetical protein
MDVSLNLTRLVVFALGLCRLDCVSGLYINVGRFWTWRVIGARWKGVGGYQRDGIQSDYGSWKGYCSTGY